MTLKVSVEDGKYTVVMGEDNRLHALRHGEEWRDLIGDGLIYSLAAEVESLRERIKELENCLFGIDSTLSNWSWGYDGDCGITSEVEEIIVGVMKR